MPFKTGDNMPGISFDGRKPRYPDIFHSNREAAMVVQKTLRGGFGQLKPGTLLCESNYDFSMVPYIPVDGSIVAGDAAVGKAFLVADYASAATSVYITIQDSYRFVVGEAAVAVRSNNSTIDLGVVSAIDRTTDPSRAKLTVVGAADANFTVANKAAVYPKAGASTKFNKPVAILDEFIDTGVGEGSMGALASALIGNALLYKNLLIAYDAGAATDLGAVDQGAYVYLK